MMVYARNVKQQLRNLFIFVSKIIKYKKQKTNKKISL